jgi:predicted metal-binding membrane protein
MTGLVNACHSDLARPREAGRASDAPFVGLTAILFGTSATLTTCWSRSMSAMPGMPMPGGWTMSTTWMRMPGATWVAAGTSFLEMWVVMMVAMMLPALTPALCRYRHAFSRIDSRSRDRLTAIAGAGYFVVWTVVGVVVYPVGSLLATMAMDRPDVARLVPTAIGVLVVGAGLLQLSAWKARRLAACREHPEHSRPLAEDARSAWRHGLRLGWHCGLACANLMAIALVLGVMNVRPMAIVAAAITIERLGPTRANVTRPLGGAVVGLGIVILARAAGLG